MKKIMLVASILIVMASSIVWAQDTPEVDRRQRRQQARIQRGVVTGEVTRAEARRLRVEQRHIRRAEKRAKADGDVTNRERAKLQRKQNRSSRDIRRQKNDRQDRN